MSGMVSLGRLFSLAAGAASLVGCQGAQAAAAPQSQQTIRYSDAHERSVLDLWLPKSDKPTPIVVFFHGGGFVGGDKTRIGYREQFLGLNQEGIAFASVGYPLVKQSQVSEQGLRPVMDECAAAVAYLQEDAARLNLDPDRIVLAGSSAGAVIVQHLAYARSLPVKGVLALQQPTGGEIAMQHIKAGGPPMALYTSSGPDDQLHHPDRARTIKAHCDKVGVNCQIFGSAASGLPLLSRPGKFVSETIAQFLAAAKQG